MCVKSRWICQLQRRLFGVFPSTRRPCGFSGSHQTLFGGCLLSLLQLLAHTVLFLGRVRRPTVLRRRLRPSRRRLWRAARRRRTRRERYPRIMNTLGEISRNPRAGELWEKVQGQGQVSSWKPSRRSSSRLSSNSTPGGFSSGGTLGDPMLPLPTRFHFALRHGGDYLEPPQLGLMVSSTTSAPPRRSLPLDHLLARTRCTGSSRWLPPSPGST